MEYKMNFLFAGMICLLLSLLNLLLAALGDWNPVNLIGFVFLGVLALFNFIMAAKK